MSNLKPQAAPNDFLVAWNNYQEIVRKNQEAEKTRRARLTPAQRAAEDNARAAKARAEAIEKQTKPYKKMESAVLGRETWTIADFCWLLLGEDPTAHEGLLAFNPFSDSESHAKFIATLESCVDVRQLAPINPSAPRPKQKFRAIDLIEVATRKNLGRHDVLRQFLPKRVTASPPAAPSATPSHAVPMNATRQVTSSARVDSATTRDATHDPRVPSRVPPRVIPSAAPEKIALAKHGTQSREKDVKRRHAALVELARVIAREGGGTESKDEIQLRISGKELNERFGRLHPEWAGLSNATCRSDRANCKPRIIVRSGRPPQTLPPTHS